MCTGIPFKIHSLKNRRLNFSRLFPQKGSFIGRDEATRTPDPYVPNVVRYQLRYIPILVCLSLRVVGMTRLELATTRPPDVYANQLRYIPLFAKAVQRYREKNN